VTNSEDAMGQICWLTLLFLMSWILISILNQKAGYPDWGILWFYSVLPGKCRHWP